MVYILVCHCRCPLWQKDPITGRSPTYEKGKGRRASKIKKIIKPKWQE